MSRSTSANESKSATAHEISNTIKSAKLLDLSGDLKGTNRFMDHLRFTVENDEGRMVQEYLLPNYVASCCKELGIDGIRYKSTGYKCCVLWKDDYFENVEGSREIISKLQ